MSDLTKGSSLEQAAMKAGMSHTTARRYVRSREMPSECLPEHDWRTRENPFAEVWSELTQLLEINPGLEAKTLFAELQRRYPGQFQDGQLRTLQRKVKTWRALEGPSREVFFPQEHYPGDLCASDFCHLTSLGVTIAGEAFTHLLYHFVLTYSNWETGMVCFSESFESLSTGLQQALWELGGVPKRHRSDSLSAAIRSPDQPEEFTRRYRALLAHCGLEGERIQIGKANENGDVEQRHHRFRLALDQALMLRESRDFSNRSEYEAFLRHLFSQLNAGRRERLLEEMPLLRPLPSGKVDLRKAVRVKVGPSSTLRVLHNTYSVPSRLIGETVEVRVDMERLEVWYGQRCVERLPRLRGENQARIDYRHIIDWLVRKPGAFANYRHREQLFPTSHFRIAYDALRVMNPLHADKEYLKLLHLAATESEAGVDAALRQLLGDEQPINAAVVKTLLQCSQAIAPATAITVAPVNLKAYDALLSTEEVA